MQFELGNLQKLSRLMGYIKVDWENIFNTKKKDTCHILFQSIVPSLTYYIATLFRGWLAAIDLHGGVE